MTSLTTTDTPVTMTSLEMVEYINSQRRPGEATLRHDSFMAKVPKVLGERDAQKFLDIYLDSMNRERSCYRFPKREACLMAMSYSYELQAKVFDRMTELEERTTIKVPTTLSGALRLAAEQAERIEQQQAKLAVAEPKALVFDTSMADKSMSVSAFCRTLPGVNLNAVKRSLFEAGYLYRKAGHYRVYAKYLSCFEEKVQQGGKWEIFPTAAGKALLSRLYQDGLLIMKGDR